MRALFASVAAAVVALGAHTAGAQDVERFHVPVTANEPQLGPADALVTIVVFTEFQCPFCARVLPTLHQLRTRYGQDLRLVFRHNPLPFHPQAMPAAELALEAFAQQGSQGFWRAHDLLFANQRALEATDLERYAAELRLDVGRARTALARNTHRPRIEADMALARQLGARGTPSFFINGRQLVGAQPVESFTRVISEELVYAQRLINAGTDRSRLYAQIISAGLREAPDRAAEVPPPPRPRPDPDAVYRVPVTAAQPVRGRRDALVTIVVFSDFQCPFCARVLPTLSSLRERYGDTLRIVWRDHPLAFHERAMPAAILAREVLARRGNDAFWRAHDLLFENQGDLSDLGLDRIATLVGIGPSRWRAARDSGIHAQSIEADVALAQRLGATGTPGFFINGIRLSGAQPIESFARVIDAQLARAREAISSGRARPSNVYDVLTSGGATEPVLLDPSDGAVASVRGGPPAEERVYEIPVPRAAPSMGPARARFVVQWFGDLQCPFTARVLASLTQLRDLYPNDLRIVWRDYPLPFHTQAQPAAEALREVRARHGDDAFWRAVAHLFANQARWSRDVNELWVVLAEVPRIDAARARAAAESGTHRAAVQSDIAAVTTAGAQIGTPSFFLDGRLLQGAQSLELFREWIEAARRRPPSRRFQPLTPLRRNRCDAGKLRRGSLSRSAGEGTLRWRAALNANRQSRSPFRPPCICCSISRRRSA